MRIPLPTNRLVAMTLVGALLTMVVAGGLAFPGLGLAGLSDGDTGVTASDQQAATDAPEPNESFTPAVQTGGDGGSGDGEYEEYEENEDDEDEAYEEGYEDEEDEAYEEGYEDEENEAYDEEEYEEENEDEDEDE